MIAHPPHGLISNQGSWTLCRPGFCNGLPADTDRFLSRLN